MRLIDADVLYATLKQRDKQLTGLFGDLGGAASGAAKLVLVQPTVDAVPVVRCEDCRFWSKYPGSSAAPQYHECMARMTHIGNLYTTAGEYCSRGERKDGDAE